MNPVMQFFRYIIRGLRLIGFTIVGSVYIPIFIVKLIIDIVSPKELPNNQPVRQA